MRGSSAAKNTGTFVCPSVHPLVLCYFNCIDSTDLRVKKAVWKAEGAILRPERADLRLEKAKDGLRGQF